MTIWFVTGTDTGVGKTMAAAAVAVIEVQRHRNVAVIKPAQTGVSADEPGDLDEVRRLAGAVDTVEGVRLPAPLAPDRAAALAGVTAPSLRTQRDLVLDAAAAHDTVIVEGSGGVAVNLGTSYTLLDIATEVQASGLRIAWLVVARSGLGTLNHSRLTVDAIRSCSGRVHGLIIGSWPAEPDMADTYNRLDLPAYTGVPVLGALPDRASELPPPRFRAEAPQWLPLLDDAESDEQSS